MDMGGRLLNKMERGKEKVERKIDKGTEWVINKMDRGKEKVLTQFHDDCNPGEEMDMGGRLLNKMERGKEKVERKIDKGTDWVMNKMDRGKEKVERKIDKGTEWVMNKIDRKLDKLKNDEKAIGMPNKMLRSMQEGRRLVSTRINRHELQMGDHIFSNRILGTYSHHGIFKGEDMVIHFRRKREYKKIMPPCNICKFQEQVHHGVVQSCLNCFMKAGDPLASNSVHRYMYGVPPYWCVIRKRGTCSSKPSKSPQEVIDTATKLLNSENDFGEYDLLKNTCEDFATFCKTGCRSSSQVSTVVFYVTVIGGVFSIPAVTIFGAVVLVMLLLVML